MRWRRTRFYELLLCEHGRVFTHRARLERESRRYCITEEFPSDQMLGVCAHLLSGVSLVHHMHAAIFTDRCLAALILVVKWRWRLLQVILLRLDDVRALCRL